MKRFFTVFLCIILMVGMVGCGKKDAVSTPASSASATQPPSAQEVFAQAKTAVLTAGNRILTYTLNRNRTVNNQTFSEKITGTASFSSLGTDAFDAIVEEELTYGTYTSTYSESYCAGNAYCTITDQSFSTAMSAQDFVTRQLPPVLIDENLYGSITLQANDDGTVFSFTQPASLENWISDQQPTLISATGTATLNTSGELVQTAYSAQYAIGSVTYSLNATVRVSTPDTLDLSVLHPDHSQNCVQITCLDAPKFLLRCVGDLFVSQAISSTAKETIISEAIPLSQIRTSGYYIIGADTDVGAAIRHSTDYQDYRNESIITTEDHTLLGGICTYSANGSDPAVLEGITAQQIRTQIEDSILSAIFALRYISDAQIMDSGNAYYITFIGNESYCSDLNANLQSFLNVDLDSTADSFENTRAGGHLTIDKASLLPTSLGMNFTRIHSFGKVKYDLSYELVHTLSLASTTANEEIMGNK